ncbi:hypothetical protein C8R43DRAFT_529151 [Mycena crocata]|nr:hypothetical protein C8R43DRAFT_529151 [Mycena crocata]
MNAFRCSECGSTTTLIPSHRVATIKSFDLDVKPGTRHHKLLTTDEVPDDNEQSFIRSVVYEAEKGVANLDEEISRLRDRLRKLEEERSLLSNYCTQNRGILSPLRRMPTELLAEIFLRTSVGEALDIKAVPWVLSRVSRHWTAVSISTPSLWSLVFIDYTKNRHPSYPLPVLDTHIARAKQPKI